MAPALTSDFFSGNPLPSRAAAARSPKPTTTTTALVYARLNPPPFPSFRIGKREEQNPSEGQEQRSNSNGFSFDFGRIPDVKSLVPAVSQPSAFGFARRKDPRTVFVAGAGGQAGVRIAQSLLRQGFAVRAGVPDLSAAQELARLAAQYKLISAQESKRLNAVESGFQDPESIAKAIGNAAKVVVTIGPAENGPTSPVTTSDALQVVRAAELAGVGHVAIIYDSSTDLPASTGNALNGITSFFSNLFAKTQLVTLAELLQKIVETNVSYTLMKTSLADDFSTQYSQNLVVAAETAGPAEDEYKVSKSQIAALVADVFSNTSVAENKVVEVSTNPSASSRPTSELFSAIPEDGRRKAYAEALAKAKAEEEAMKASERARKAAKAAKKLEEEVSKLAEQESQAATLAKAAQEKTQAAGTSAENFFRKAKDLSGGLSWDKFSSQITNTVSQKIDEMPKPKIEMPKMQIATVRGEAKARSLTPKKAIIKQATSKPKPTPKAQPQQDASKREVRKVFGGLFKQETIYVDDD